MNTAAVLVAKLLQEAAITGEYWIYDDGSINYADGDIGDTNHEGLVLAYVRRLVLDAVGGGDTDYFDDSSFESALEEVLPEDAFGENLRLRTIDYITKNYDSPQREQELRYIAPAFDASIDLREWAMRNLGWIWVRGDHCTAYQLDHQTLKALKDGVGEILDTEGHYDSEDAAEDVSLSVRSLKDGKHYYIALADLESGDFNFGTTDYQLDQPAPRTSVRRMDIDAQNPYYGKNLGDSLQQRSH